MNFEQIELQNFRNIEKMTLLPCAGINIIHGENAQGKTNLIEAIWLFSGARSFRGAKEREMIQFGKPGAVLSCSYFSQKRTQTARIQLGEIKGVWVNDIIRPSLSALTGEMPMVVFSPIHLSLIKEGPVLRRRFIDEAIGQLYPSYQENMAYYHRALMQRSALLRDAANYAPLLDTLDIWDQHLARAGAQMIRLRMRYTNLLCEKAAAIYEGISGGRESLKIQYQCSVVGTRPDMSQEALRSLYLQALKKSRAEDLRQGKTLCGVHRDDLYITLNDLAVRQYGSQGQQRSVVLALKLAECGIIEENTGKTPVILLDDVMSELDRQRRDYLLSKMDGKQVFITCCEEDVLKRQLDGRSFFICNGMLG